MPISEDIITGKKYRVWSALANKWKRYSFWSKASDVEMNDGSTVETTMSLVKGKSYETIEQAMADLDNIPVGSMVYTNDGDNYNVNASNVIYDDGTQQGSNVQTQITQINADLTDKVERMSDVSGYQTVDVLGYNPTTKKLGLKVNGADTVIPFSSSNFNYGFVFSGYRNNDSTGKLISVFNGKSFSGPYYCSSNKAPSFNSSYCSRSAVTSYNMTVTFNKAGYVYNMSTGTRDSISAGQSVTFGGLESSYKEPCIAYFL